MSSTAPRVLLDECVPRRFGREVAAFNPSHVVTEGWAGRRNGALLQLMRAAGFTVFVTVDRNLVFQQDVSRSGIAVVVLHAPSNRVPDLRPLVPRVLDAIASATAGDVIHVGG